MNNKNIERYYNILQRNFSNSIYNFDKAIQGEDLFHDAILVVPDDIVEIKEIEEFINLYIKKRIAKNRREKRLTYSLIVDTDGDTYKIKI